MGVVLLQATTNHVWVFYSIVYSITGKHSFVISAVLTELPIEPTDISRSPMHNRRGQSRVNIAGSCIRQTTIVVATCSSQEFGRRGSPSRHHAVRRRRHRGESIRRRGVSGSPDSIGADSTGATGTFAPVLSKVLWREYGFAPVLFEPSKNVILLIYFVQECDSHDHVNLQAPVFVACRCLCTRLHSICIVSVRLIAFRHNCLICYHCRLLLLIGHRSSPNIPHLPYSEAYQWHCVYV